MGALNFCPKRKQMHARKERNDLLFFLVPRLLDDPIFREKVVEMERAHPTEISIWDLTLTIHYNYIDRPVFLVNGKQPKCPAPYLQK